MPFYLPSFGPVNFSTIIKSADQDVTNNTNQDDTELQFATATGKIYAVQAMLIVSGNNATGDYAFRFAVAANTMDGRGNALSVTTADATQTSLLSAAAAATTGTISVGTAADQGFPIAIAIWFAFRQNTGATTFKLQFGNASAAAGRTSRTMAGSYLSYAQLN